MKITKLRWTVFLAPMFLSSMQSRAAEHQWTYMNQTDKMTDFVQSFAEINGKEIIIERDSDTLLTAIYINVFKNINPNSNYYSSKIDNRISLTLPKSKNNSTHPAPCNKDAKITHTFKNIKFRECFLRIRINHETAEIVRFHYLDIEDYFWLFPINSSDFLNKLNKANRILIEYNHSNKIDYIYEINPIKKLDMMQLK